MAAKKRKWRKKKNSRDTVSGAFLGTTTKLLSLVIPSSVRSRESVSDLSRNLFRSGSAENLRAAISGAADPPEN